MEQERDTISYSEWARLLNGLLPDTPLGRIIEIRAEKDRKKIKAFSPYQHQVRKEWAAFRARSPKHRQVVQLDVKQLQEMFKSMFS